MGLNQFNDGGMFICVDFKKIPLENNNYIIDKDIVTLLDRALLLKKWVLAKNFIKKDDNGVTKELNFIFNYANGIFSGIVYSGGNKVCELYKDGTSYRVSF